MRRFTIKREAALMAIEVAADTITLAQVKPGADGRPTVARYESYRKETNDVESLTRLRAGLNLERYRFTTTLQHGEYQMMQVEPPPVPAAEMKAAIRWRVKDLLDYPADQTTVDLLEVPTDESAVARNRFVFVACSPNNVVQRYVRLFQSARIPLDSIDLPELGQRNIAALFEPAGRGVAFLAFDPLGCLLTVTAGGELYLARRIEVTQGQLSVSDDEQRYALYERLLTELQRSLDNFERQFHFVTLAKLLLAPLPESVSLQEYLQQNLYLPVERAELANVLDLSPAPSLAGATPPSGHFTLLGAALREYRGTP